MQKSEVKDLTTGSPMKLILSFAIPMLLGFLFQQFYNMVDTIIVGKCLGVSSLAAVGSTGSINFMIIGFCTGACSGFAIPVAQKFGAGDYTGVRGECGLALSGVCGGHDDDRGTALHEYPAVDEHAGGHYPGSI